MLKSLWKSGWILLNSGRAFPPAMKEEAQEVFWSHKLDVKYLLKHLGRGWWMGRIYGVAAHWISFPTPTK